MRPANILAILIMVVVAIFMSAVALLAESASQ